MAKTIIGFNETQTEQFREIMKALHLMDILVIKHSPAD